MSKYVDEENRELTDSFVMESRELIDFVVEDILQLEEKADEELINRIFRTFHTVKGNAAMLGYTKLSSFAHKAEDLLSRIRDKEKALDKKVIDSLLIATDVLKDVIDRMAVEYHDDTDMSKGVAAVEAVSYNAVSYKAVPAKEAPPKDVSPKDVSAKEEVATPVQTPSPPVKLRLDMSMPPPEKEKLKILVVEDEFVSRAILLEILEKYGICHVATDGEEAVLAVQNALIKGGEHTYDLICMDIMMPKLDGIEAVKEIRRMEKEHGVKQANEASIIMTTVKRDPKTVIRSFYESGATAYIAKPIDEKKLEREIGKRWLLKRLY